MFREPSLEFLKYSIAFLLAGSAAILIAIFVFVPDQTMRSLGPGSACLLALTAWFLLARDRIETTVYLLAIGMWSIVTGVALFTGGLHSTASLLYPQIIFLLGWFIGVRAALAAALLTIATTLGFALAESWGLLPVPFPTPPVIGWIIQSFIVALSVVLIVYLIRSHQSRLNKVNELGSDLNRAQAVAHVGSWVYEIVPDVMRLSAETCRIFGVPEGARSSHDIYLSRIHPEDRAAVDSAWQATLKDGEPFDNEHRILVGETVRWVRQRAELERSPDGTPLRSVGITQDITERKQAEAARETLQAQLRNGNETYRSILATSHDGFWQVDVNGKLVDVNAAYCRQSGYSREELLGMRISDLEAIESKSDTAEHIRRIMEAGNDQFESVHRRKDGSAMDVEISASYSKSPGGQFFGFSRDITERKRTENALKSSEDKFRRAFYVNPDSININRLEDGLYVSINRGFTKIMGYTEDEIIGHTSAEFNIWVNPEDRARLVQGLRKDGVVTNLEALFRAKDGSICYGLMSAAVIVIENVPHIISVTRDMTERKKAEEAHAQLEAHLRESQKMQALGTLAGGVAHDFNNIIAAIIGNVELMRQDLGPEHLALASLDEISKAGRRARTLVQQILSFSRGHVIERKVISLAPIVEESVRLLRATLPSGIGLGVECAPDAPKILADATQMQQVLLNLCNNAWHAMQGQERPGVIQIQVQAEVRNGMQFSSLTVSDNGQGMDEATSARIFEPFFTTKAVGEGTGLGLSVVHGIVNEHGASIEFRSALGEGTTFVIHFPAAQLPGPGTPDTATGVAVGDQTILLRAEGQHILYVDDDEAIVFLVTRLLERQGYRVSGYTDARAALAAVGTNPGEFDLAVTDYNMPGMSGLDVALALRKIRADLPVVLASGYITEELRAKAAAVGIRELIYKPNTVEDLCQAVARLVHTAAEKSKSS
jgi:PAS domain S-box-containing protein